MPGTTLHDGVSMENETKGISLIVVGVTDNNKSESHGRC